MLSIGKQLWKYFVILYNWKTTDRNTVFFLNNRPKGAETTPELGDQLLTSDKGPHESNEEQ